MSNNKNMDLICLGRAAFDIYGEQIGSRLEDTNSFAKYLGASSSNIAYGTSRLGLKSAILTRVGDEHMGRFVREEPAGAGVDTSQLITNKERLTILVLLGIKGQVTFPLIFYRNDCSTELTYDTSKKAIEYVKATNTKDVLDIDYRPEF